MAHKEAQLKKYIIISTTCELDSRDCSFFDDISPTLKDYVTLFAMFLKAQRYLCMHNGPVLIFLKDYIFWRVIKLFPVFCCYRDGKEGHRLKLEKLDQLCHVLVQYLQLLVQFPNEICLISSS